jgi:hypothetical protein
MPGSLVHDALAPSLTTGVTIPLTATATSTGVEVSKPMDARVRLKTGTVASTGNSATLTVEVQSSNTSDFSAGVVSNGRFALLTGTDAAQSSLERYLDVDIKKRYARAIFTVAGTAPSYGGLVCEVVTERFHRNANDTA